jgi:hypothetical protein
VDDHHRRLHAAHGTHGNHGKSKPTHHRKPTGRVSVRDVLLASCGIKYYVALACGPDSAPRALHMSYMIRPCHSFMLLHTAAMDFTFFTHIKTQSLTLNNCYRLPSSSWLCSLASRQRPHLGSTPPTIPCQRTPSVSRLSVRAHQMSAGIRCAVSYSLYSSSLGLCISAQLQKMGHRFPCCRFNLQIFVG